MPHNTAAVRIKCFFLIGVYIDSRQASVQNTGKTDIKFILLSS